MEVRFDSRVVRLSAVKKAAYRLSSLASVSIAIEGDAIVCAVTTAPSQPTLDPAFAATFNAAVLDQDLREEIGEQTAPLRNAILAMAFAPITNRQPP